MHFEDLLQLIPADYRSDNYARKYLHMDGAPVGDGVATGLKRYLKSPVMCAAALTTLFMATGHALLAPPNTRLATFIGYALLDASPLMTAKWTVDGHKKVDNFIAIDISKYESLYPQLSDIVSEGYKRDAYGYSTFAAGLLGFGIALQGMSSLLPMISPSEAASSGNAIYELQTWVLTLFREVALSQGSIQAITGGMSTFASSQFAKQKWNLTVRPPSGSAKSDYEVPAGVTAPAHKVAAKNLEHV